MEEEIETQKVISGVSIGPSIKKNFFVHFCCSSSGFFCLFVFCCFDPYCTVHAQLPHGMWDPSSPVRDQTHVPYTERQILNHWATRQVPGALNFWTLRWTNNSYLWEENRCTWSIWFLFFKVWMVDNMRCLRAAGLCTHRAALRSGDVSPLHGMLMAPLRVVQHGTDGRASERKGCWPLQWKD